MSHSYGEEYDTALAIVGISGRFPDAQNVETFWQNILHKVKSIRTFSDEEVLASGVDPAVLKRPNYVKAGAILKDISLFDAAFFGYTPREADLMDPQHRLFLECSWEALEQAGYATESYQGLVGVFAGSGFCSYMMKHVVEYPNFAETFGKLQIASGNERDSLASTVSYKLNLKGPSIAVQTFCSTSLVAVHLASQSLLNYDCDIALAGGVAITIPQEYGYLYEEGGILSPDGECRTFDGKAQGSVMSDGVAVVALKRLEDALQDGDTIYALIRGSAVNNDGNVRANYTAPGLAGQSSVISAALGTAEIDIETIGYIEAHGTGTSLGDAIELAAMIKAFGGTKKKQYCAIGSVKPNIGHLDRASGVTGLIKAALALHNKVLPPSLNFERANSDIDLAQSPFYVNTQLTPWKSTHGPRRAGVNSFGVGGTNAHVVLEEAPTPDYAVCSRSSHLLLLSAKTENALQAARANLYEYLCAHPAISLPDVAYTLQIARQTFNHRLTLVCSDLDDAIAQLAPAVTGSDIQAVHQVKRQRPVVYLLAGEEGLPLDGGKELYQQEQLFCEQVDHCCELLTPLLDLDLRVHLLATSAAESLLTQPRYRQSATFVLLYALTQLLKAWGIEPTALLGDRVGCMVAATLAGVLNLSDALELLVRQADMNLEGHAGLALSDGQQADNIQSWFKGVKFARPQIPCVSAATGNWLTSLEASDPDCWLEQTCRSDSLRQGINTLLEKQEEMGEVVLLTIGTGNLCSVQSKQQERIVDQLGPVEPGASEMAALLTTLGRLWLAGVQIDWQKMYEQEQRRRVVLPTYPFERQRYWLDIPGSLEASTNSTRQQDPSLPVKKTEIADWFYVPEWKQVARQKESGLRARALSPLLCFVETSGFGEQLVTSLQAQKEQVIRVYRAEYYWKQDEQTFYVRPGQLEDYALLLTELHNLGQLPRQILHAWTLASSLSLLQERERFEETQRHGLYSLVALVRALEQHHHTNDITLTVLTDRLYPIDEQEVNEPAKATLLSACKIIAQEYSGIYTRCLDLPVECDETYLAMVQEELKQADLCPDIAFRNGQRWEQHFRSIHLPALENGHIALRLNGVYVIVGGLGKVGQLISEHLVHRVQARLVLIGRTGLPVREQWENWLVEHESDNEISSRIRHIQNLEALGAEVEICSASADNIEQMRHVLQHTVDRYGSIHGVIYVPAISDEQAFGLMQTLQREAYESHFQAKVYGLSTLEQVLKPYTLDFCLVFSSLSSVLGGLGFLPYSAANAFVDAFVQRHNRQKSQPWIAVSWDSWQVRENPHGQLGGSIVEYAMTPKEGLEAFERVLQSPAYYLINSTGDLNDRVRQWIYLENIRQQKPAVLDSQPTASTRVQYDQAMAQKPIAPFGDNLEQLIVNIWRETLGIKNVSLQTNFFDLGGNSLIGLQVMSRLRQELQIQLSPVILFEAPTVQELARCLRSLQTETGKSLTCTCGGNLSPHRTFSCYLTAKSFSASVSCPTASFNPPTLRAPPAAQTDASQTGGRPGDCHCGHGRPLPWCQYPGTILAESCWRD